MNKSAAFSLAMAVLSSRGMKVSSLRVMTTSQPALCSSSFFSRNPTSSTTSFSRRPVGPMVPVSWPPCPGSITMRPILSPRARVRVREPDSVGAAALGTPAAGTAFERFKRCRSRLAGGGVVRRVVEGGCLRPRAPSTAPSGALAPCWSRLRLWARGFGVASDFGAAALLLADRLMAGELSPGCGGRAGRPDERWSPFAACSVSRLRLTASVDVNHQAEGIGQGQYRVIFDLLHIEHNPSHGIGELPHADLAQKTVFGGERLTRQSRSSDERSQCPAQCGPAWKAGWFRISLPRPRQSRCESSSGRPNGAGRLPRKVGWRGGCRTRSRRRHLLLSRLAG